MSSPPKKSSEAIVVTSAVIFPVAEFRTKWERLWPKNENGNSVKSKESLVSSRVQRYSVHDSNQISKQIGYLNTVNIARVYSDGEDTWCWVIHNKLQPNSGLYPDHKMYTSTCFIQPSVNKS